MKLDYIMDPGHGWVKVKRSLLAKLEILPKITPFSYQRGEYVYLEEDLDAPCFRNAAEAAGIEVDWRY